MEAFPKPDTISEMPITFKGGWYQSTLKTNAQRERAEKERNESTRIEGDDEDRCRKARTAARDHCWLLGWAAASSCRCRCFLGRCCCWIRKGRERKASPAGKGEGGKEREIDCWGGRARAGELLFRVLVFVPKGIRLRCERGYLLWGLCVFA